MSGHVLTYICSITLKRYSAFATHSSALYRSISAFSVDLQLALCLQTAQSFTGVPAYQRVQGSTMPAANVAGEEAVKLLPPPTKGLCDTKEYRSLQLHNGLRVLLISDHVRHGTASAPAVVTKEGEDTIRKDSCGAESTEEGGANEWEDVDEEGEGEDEEENEEEDEATDEEAECDEEEDDCEDEVKPPTKKSGDTEYKAAAALAVSWGSYEDPPELPGLMHFLEHMVFMGSEKYPAENSFDDFIRRHGGNDNAYTDCQHTNFHVDVQEAYLWEALDRFSQFFVAPLMKKNAMERERSAVDSEFTMARPDDSNREHQVLSSLAPPGHPCSVFTWGNAASLSQRDDDVVHAALHKYRQKFYSSQYMALAVQSRHTLDDMQDAVVRIFSRIPNNGLPLADYTRQPFPFPASTFNKLVEVEAQKAKHVLVSSWCLPPLRARYRTHPCRLLSNLLGHEGKGSLLSYYKMRNWAVGVEVESETGDYDSSCYCTMLRVKIDLTEPGVHHTDEVLLALFQYTALLRANPPSDDMFKEFQQLARLNVDFETESDAIDNVEEAAACMLRYEPQDYLTGDTLLFEFDQQFVKEVSDHLTPDNVNIIIRSRLLGDFTGPDVETEKWFGTKYNVKEISPEWRSLFATAETTSNPSLHLPKPNPFIPTDFSLLTRPSPAHSAPSYPSVLRQHPVEGALYYKPDHKYELPMVQVQLQMVLRDRPERGTHKFHAVMALLLQLYRYQLMEPAYDAVLARCGYGIRFSGEAIVLNASGFTENIQRLLDLLLEYLEKFTDNFKEEHFNTLLDLEVRRQYNSACKPNSVRNELRLHMLVPQTVLTLQVLRQLGSVTSQDVLDLAKDVLNDVQLNMLVQGNISSAGAEALYDSARRRVKRSKGDVQLMPPTGYRCLPPGISVLRVSATNPSDGNSAIANYYQGPPGTLRDQILMDFVASAIEEQCFDTLRTREQLGYSVHTQGNETNGVMGLTVYITPQAEKFSLHHVDCRVEAFLHTFGCYLREMTPASFATLKETVLKMKKIPDLSLAEEVARNWTEIERKEYMFDRLERQITLIESVTQEDVVKYYESFVSPALPDYRKLSVQVVGCADYKNNKPPHINLFTDGGDSCLKLQSPPDTESHTPATCPAPPQFILNCEQYIAGLRECPHHPIL